MSCATMAVVAAGLLPQKAEAQAFQGRIGSSTGTVARTNTSGTSETITIDSPTATINWTPTGQPNASGNIDFLPVGNVATFQGTVNAGDYTVLNRIIPSGAFPIELNGTVQSFLASNATGGNIWFYSPNGILIGASAVFNVGGLLLTTADPGSNWSTSANGFTATMGPGSSSSFVTVSKGAQINAQNSYVAIVAPKITQAGTVNVHGSAAYVGAEQLTMTFNQGLFDIAVDVGTDDPNGVIHTGTTTGTGNASSADNHSIYMVAVPKNQVLTMLLSGRIGFSDVSGAAVQNGQIVLSAGYNVTNGAGTVPVDGLDLGGAFGSKNVNIDIEGGDFTSNVLGFATGTITATGGSASGGSGTLSFAHDVSLQGLVGASLTANSGDTINVGGNATISADDRRSFDNSNSQNPLNALAGSAQVVANSGGSINIGGNLSVTADAQGGNSVLAGLAGGSAQGGIARLQSNGGSISVGGNAQVSANATGGNSVAGGGEGDGGDAFMTLNGGSIAVIGMLGLQADGQGGTGAPGGAGFGGWAYASIDSAGGTLDLPGGLRLESDGIGGSGLANPNGIGGDGGEGVGGSASFSASTTLQAGASLNLQLTNVGLVATGIGGKGGDGLNGGAGGQANGGEAFAELGSGTIATGEFDIDVTGHGGGGGAASNGSGGAGGDAFGGFADFFTQGSVTADLHANAGTFGGAGGSGSTMGNGGNAEGEGFVFLEIDPGASLTGNVDLFAGSVGGDGASGGEGIGGDAEAFIQGSLNAPEVTVTASGTGGNGLTGDGGFSDGGSAALFIDGGTVNVTGDLFIGAVGNADLNGDGNPDGGSGAANGGDSQGGNDSIEIGFGGGSLTVGGTTTITARAVGGAGGANDGITGGTGGSGQGGEADFFASNTSCTDCGIGGGTSPAVTNVALHDLTINASGLGGAGGGAATGGAGGDGNGGSTDLDIEDASFTAGDISAVARGLGGMGGAGSSGLGGAGGFAEGGDNFFFLGSGASINASTYLALANAIGGDGGSGSAGLGDGGSADSGFNEAAIDGTATFGGSNDAGTGFVMTAFAQGGSGQTAGSASAGSTSITISGSLTAAGHVQASASAMHGNGSGGTAEAGSASIDVSGTLDAASLAVIANAFDSSLGVDPTGFGGTVDLDFESGAVTSLGDVSVSAQGSDGAVSVLGNLAASGSVDFESGGDIDFANVTANKLNFEAGGAVTGGDINVADHVGGQAQGAITLSNLTAGPNLPTSNDGFSVGIASATSITVGNVGASGGVGFATLGSLTTGNVSAGDLFLALASGDISTGSITTSPTGRVYFADSSMFTAAGGPDNFDPSLVLGADPVATHGSITVNGAVRTGELQAAAGTNLTLADVTAGSSVVVSAGGLADFEGKVSAPDITVTSANIDIAAGASLGVFGVTDLLTLNAVSDQPIVVGHGGSPAAGQYVLDEAGDIQAASLVINALRSDGGAAPDIDIFGVKIDGSQTSGGGFGSIAVNTGGSIVVGGAVKFTDAGATDSLALNAGKNVEVVTDTGSIAMTDSSGTLSGTLKLSGDNVWIADQSIISALETNPTSVTPDQLAANGGTANPNGFVSAGGVSAQIGGSFLVQNSGTLDDPGGITVGDGGLIISTTASAASVVTAAATLPLLDIFGRQIRSNGTIITGNDFVPVVKVAGSFSGDSTINGCSLAGCAPPQAPPPPAPATQTLAADQVLGPIGASDSNTIAGEDQQQAEEDKKKDKGSSDDSVETWLGLINAGPINLDQPIDEPVTSGSDVDMNLGPGPGGSL